MNPESGQILGWIDGQAEAMRDRVVRWAEINTGSTNLAGLERFCAMLREEFAPLGGQARQIALAPLESVDSQGRIIHTPVGQALSIIQRPSAGPRVFLCIHMDTVYPADHPFQTCTEVDENTLQGPGVADAKGGLAVMLTALTALEQSPAGRKIGWEVLINPDEEIGSMGSLPLLKEAAGRNHVGLLFEPALADGSLVDRRKGSGSFVLVVRGRSAHAGRDFAQGRNAVVAMAHLAVKLHELNQAMEGITLNVGKVEGGGPSNVVPDLAIVRFNVRTTTAADEARVLGRVRELLAELNSRDGIRAELHGAFTSPPKIAEVRGRALMDVIETCGRELNMPIQWKASGGTCDGNKLAAAGLANVDTMGPCGGNLHSPREFVLVDSLTQRAKLAAMVLMKLAAEG